MNDFVEIIGWITIIGGFIFVCLFYLRGKDRAKYAPTELDKRIADNERKQNIIARVYAYEYENELCGMFARVATVNSGQYDLNFTTTLSSDEIISEFSERLHISEIESEKIFQHLRKHGVLVGDTSKDQYYPWILGRWNNNYWSVISYDDTNIHKWMINNDYPNPEVKSTNKR